MLQLFRSGLTSYFASALLGLLIASFALWGIGGDILGGVGNNVAQIGDEKLTLQDYAREFQNKFSDIQQQSNGEVTREMVVDQGYARRWVADLVQRKTFAYAAHDLNIRVTDEELRNFIMSIEAFQDTFGQFNKDKFDQLAAFRGYSSGEFEEVLRKDLERQYLMTSVVSGVSVPETVQKTFIKYLSETRTADIITIPATLVENIPEPDEESLKKYYQDNSANYMAPEYRDFRFITLSTSDFVKDVTLTDEEIKEALAAVKNTTPEGETRDIEQILFDDKNAAEKAYSDLQAGRSFADLIIASGSTAEDAALSGQTLQTVTDTFGGDAAKRIFEAGEGSHTAPVETVFGWRLFNIKKITSSAPETTDLKAETINNLKKDKALNLLYDKSELISDELAAGASLADIATALKLNVKSASKVDLSGYDANGDLARDVPENPAFLTRVFGSHIGDRPMLEELSDSEYYLMVVDNIHPSALRPYEEVKTSVRELWMMDARKNQARDKANEFLAKADENIPLEDLSKATPGTAFNKVTLTRFDQTAKVTRDIQSSIFDLNIGHAKIMPASDGNGFVIVKLLSRDYTDGAFPAAQQDMLKQQLGQQYQQQILANYWLYLEANLPVRFNEQGINTVHNSLTTREQ